MSLHESAAQQAALNLAPGLIAPCTCRGSRPGAASPTCGLFAFFHSPAQGQVLLFCLCVAKTAPFAGSCGTPTCSAAWTKSVLLLRSCSLLSLAALLLSRFSACYATCCSNLRSVYNVFGASPAGIFRDQMFTTLLPRLLWCSALPVRFAL